MHPTIKLPDGLVVIERGWLSANGIFLWSDDESVLIDSGYHSHRQLTASLIKHELAQYGHSRLHKLVNTHLHSDHCGGNRILQDLYHPKTYIPLAEATAVTDWNEDLLTYRATGQECEPFKFDELLVPGQFVTLGRLEWKILGAPGHDPHSIMLFNEQYSILISADALWENGFGVVFPELIGESGFSEIASTLDLIDDLKPKIIIPGHGRPFTDIETSLQTARSKLAYLSSDPKRNAEHAAKVLLKYKLLEWQSIEISKAIEWIKSTPLMTTIGKQLGREIDDLADWLPPALCKTGGAIIHQNMIANAEK